MVRPITIRRSLFVNLAAVVLLLGSAVTTITLVGSRHTADTWARHLMNRSTAQIHAELNQYFEPVVKALHVARSWGEHGLLNVDSPAQLNHVLQPLITQWPQISSILVADTSGREHMLLHLQGSWLNRWTRVADWGGTSLLFQWTDPRDEPTVTWRELNYDPRTRPWHQGAMRELPSPVTPGASPGLYWTAPYTFFTTRQPGITAATRFIDPTGIEHVVGFDMLLTDISAFTTRLQVAERGQVMVLTEDNLVVGLPRHSRFDDPTALRDLPLQQANDLGIPIAAMVSRILATRSAHEQGPLRMIVEREPWWIDARPFTLLSGQPLRIAVLVPEADLLGALGNLRIGIALSTLAALAWGLWRTVVLARRYGDPIKALVKQSERISHGDLTGGPPVQSSVVEVQRLAQAHEQMRHNLRSLVKLETDMALAREIQQRAFPARMPRIPGYEVVAFSQPADATGGDIYDVVGFSKTASTSISSSDDIAWPHALLMLADATGHGIGPALSVVQVRAMLRMAARTGQPLTSMIPHLNAQLLQDLHAGRFVTAWIGHLDATQQQLHFFSAGQAPLILRRWNQSTAEMLEADSPPLGITDFRAEVKLRTVSMEVGDLFAVLSDGIFDARNPAGEPLGAPRVLEMLTAPEAVSASATLKILCNALRTHCQGKPQSDDQTALIIYRAS